MMLDLLRLCRLYYALPMSAILTLTIWYAAGDQMPAYAMDALRATVALALVIAGSYVLNDVCDRRTDRINAPERPIPAGRVPPIIAALWAGALLLNGLIIAVPCGWRFFTALGAVVGLLVFYDLTSKRLGIGKQLLVALLMTSYYALAFALVGHTTSSRAPTLYIFPLWLFLTSFGYEILKDIRDIRGDQTLVVQLSWVQQSPQSAVRVAHWAVIIGAIVLVAPAFAGCGWLYLAITPAALALALYSTRLTGNRALVTIYGEVVIVGIAALADVMILGS
jgi:geranylgeranylglycerol-phosphate geranylgeranyltransferase